jgi:3-deoxy-manno-octulosonate cytidylyltransferase (CMP-KDO synthetase)
MAIVGIIPARFASTRLPGKPLLSDTGRPLIQHVVEAARRARKLDRIIVATDDPRIARAVEGFGGEVVLTREDHPTGTDRVAEVIARLPEARLIVNIQGDEPELSGHAIDLVVALLEADAEAPMATLATPIRDEAVYRDPSCVKVVASTRGRALYFSRSPIPHYRDGLPDLRPDPPAHLPLGPYAHRREFRLRLAENPASPVESAEKLEHPGSPIPHYRDDPHDLRADPPAALLHLGLYAYRRDFLLRLAEMPPSPLESAEKLEQLRVLESGYPIALGIVQERSVGIDTPEDYRRFVDRWRAGVGAIEP